MAFNYISAAEAASLIKHGYNIGLSGFTPAGTAKAVTAQNRRSRTCQGKSFPSRYLYRCIDR